MEPMETKAEVRKRYKKLRDDTSAQERAAWSDRICAGLSSFCVSRRIRRIGVFWPLGSEIDLRSFINGHPEWTFVFPRVSSTQPPRLIWGPEPLEPGVFGLMEPVHAQHFMPPVQLLVVPGLVFDAEGFRIGYGGGFYDALLERLSPDVITLGAAFEIQRTQHLPHSPQDMPVHGVMTEQGLTWFQRPGEESD
jgi:5-formyltetrahydrofolate cyclo-ligase